jgi:hypothetical protein
MRHLIARRMFAGTLTVLIAVVLALTFQGSALSLHNSAYLSGWCLLGLMLFLTLYNIRKKLTYPPLLASSMWLQLHIYGGFLAFAVFFMHTGLELPNGPFQIGLAILAVSVLISGVIGLLLTRLIPPRLASRSEEVLFERIPTFMRELRRQAEQLVIDSVKQSETTTLADFYEQHLVDFFARPRHTWRHPVQSRGPFDQLVHELTALQRYLSAPDREFAERLGELMRAKDNLDDHHALQGALKVWLFLHIPLTYVLLLFAVVHVVLIHLFSGSLT